MTCIKLFIVVKYQKIFKKLACYINGIKIVGFKNYNKKLLITLFSILAFIVMLNYLVNPYNIFQQRIFKTTLLKPEAKIQERVTKPIGLKINKRKIDAEPRG